MSPTIVSQFEVFKTNRLYICTTRYFLTYIHISIILNFLNWTIPGLCLWPTACSPRKFSQKSDSCLARSDKNSQTSSTFSLWLWRSAFPWFWVPWPVRSSTWCSLCALAAAAAPPAPTRGGISSSSITITRRSINRGRMCGEDMIYDAFFRGPSFPTAASSITFCSIIFNFFFFKRYQ